MINDASNSETPVKITRMGNNINSNDAIINDYTNITLVRDPTFTADQRFNTDAVVSLGDLLSLAPGQLINLKCHVSKIYEPTTHNTRNGDIEKQEVIISGESNSIKLVLFGSDVSTLKVNKSYILKNLRLNTFKNTVYLNSTLAQKFDYQEIPEIDHTEASPETEDKLLCKIVGVISIALKVICIKCDKKIDLVDVENVLVTCSECNSKMLKSSCRKNMQFSIVVSDISHDKNLSLFFPNDQAFQLKNMIGFSCSSEEEVVKSLLEFPDIFEVTFEVSSKVVLSVSKV